MLRLWRAHETRALLREKSASWALLQGLPKQRGSRFDIHLFCVCAFVFAFMSISGIRSTQTPTHTHMHTCRAHTSFVCAVSTTFHQPYSVLTASRATSVLHGSGGVVADSLQWVEGVVDALHK